jgi:tRNA G18 (ribose-2'-O)-methylase SpoU
MPIVEITDPADPRLALYRAVPDAELLRTHGLFVAEGRLVVDRLLRDVRLTPRSLMVTQTALTALGGPPVTHPSLPVYVVPQSVMNGVTGFNLHRGCLALAERPAARDWRDIAGATERQSDRLFVVLERIGNADNIGSIFRSAAAFGARAVLLGPGCADPLYRKAIRTSMGAALTLPFADAVPWPECLDRLRELGIVTVALTPASSAPPVAEVARALDGHAVALLLGHEGDGLSAEAQTRCARLARIPITPAVDSLNVAVAGAVALSAFGGSALRSHD